MSGRPRLTSRPSSPTLSAFTFAPSKILPVTPSSVTISEQPAQKHPPIDSLRGFDQLSMGADDFDLEPPPPKMSHGNAERLAARLFSADHLDIILKDPPLSHRFTSFLNRFRPQSVPSLVRYIESQKAIAAVRYANSLAEQISSNSNSRRSSRRDAAVVDTKFEGLSKKAVDELVGDALPAYITFMMVSVVTEVLVKEITGNNTPLMRELVQGLAEVYCLTDPSLPDNPIVFASEEFYNTTQYGQEYVVGKNCRFLQGPNTSTQAVKRISEALRKGEEASEILLNYRRDGSPFLNLVMMAPLMDTRGAVRYFIGCQIDISPLIAGGRGLESFKKLLDQDRYANDKPLPDPLAHKPSLRTLGELTDLLNEEEIEVMQKQNLARDAVVRASFESGRSSPTRIPHSVRRFIGTDENEATPWPPTSLGGTGKLPGVYRNYILVRPYPSLRIIFTSPALRIPGFSQSNLMDRIGGPKYVRDGLMEALSQGVGVTAKVSWLTHSSTQHKRTNSDIPPEHHAAAFKESEALEGKPRWIHCTPLLGSDSKPGVWMVVMVDKEEITGCLNSAFSARSPIVIGDRETRSDGWPVRGASIAGTSMASARYTSAKLYAEYLRREGRTEEEMSQV